MDRSTVFSQDELAGFAESDLAALARAFAREIKDRSSQAERTMQDRPPIESPRARTPDVVEGHEP